MKKYKLTKEPREVGGCVLHRIMALRDFGNVKRGDLGGFVEKETNLSQEGNCWIYDEAAVYNSAEVRDDATVRNFADISDGAMVSGNAKVHSHAKIWDNARIFDSAVVLDYATVCGCAKVSKNIVVYGNAVIKGNAVIESISDYIVFKNWWSSGRYFTWTRSNDKWSVGCFYGTGEELIKRAYADSREKGHEYERVVKYVESIKQELK